jgi:hypothetical protein
MKRARCARSESVKIDWRMPAFVWSRNAMKLLLRIASSRVENNQAKILSGLRCHYWVSPRITRIDANKSKNNIGEICVPFQPTGLRNPFVFQLGVMTEIHQQATQNPLRADSSGVARDVRRLLRKRLSVRR